MLPAPVLILLLTPVTGIAGMAVQWFLYRLLGPALVDGTSDLIDPAVSSLYLVQAMPLLSAGLVTGSLAAATQRWLMPDEHPWKTAFSAAAVLWLLGQVCLLLTPIGSVPWMISAIWITPEWPGCAFGYVLGASFRSPPRLAEWARWGVAAATVLWVAAGGPVLSVLAPLPSGKGPVEADKEPNQKAVAATPKRGPADSGFELVEQVLGGRGSEDSRAAQAALFRQQMTSCRLDLPDDTVVYAVSTREGKLLPTRAMEGEQPGRVDIDVTTKDHPVALVLSAHESVEWRVGAVEGAKIAGILVSSFNPGLVLGPDASVKVLSISASPPHDWHCESVEAVTPGRGKISDLQDLDFLTQSVTGHAIDQISYRRDTETVRVGPWRLFDEVAYSNFRGDPLAQDPDVVPNGLIGLKELANRGMVRHADKEELQTWIQGHRRTIGGWTRLNGVDAWVLTGARLLPPHPFDGLGPVLILPEGMAKPKGPESWAILKMSDYTCEGMTCGMLMETPAESPY